MSESMEPISRNTSTSNPAECLQRHENLMQRPLEVRYIAMRDKKPKKPAP